MQDEQNQALHWEVPCPAKVPQWVNEFPRESSRSGGVSMDLPSPVCLEGLEECGVSPAGKASPPLPAWLRLRGDLALQNLTP